MRTPSAVFRTTFGLQGWQVNDRAEEEERLHPVDDKLFASVTKRPRVVWRNLDLINALAKAVRRAYHSLRRKDSCQPVVALRAPF
jgi:hypothetical protein